MHSWNAPVTISTAASRIECHQCAVTFHCRVPISLSVDSMVPMLRSDLYTICIPRHCRGSLLFVYRGIRGTLLFVYRGIRGILMCLCTYLFDQVVLTTNVGDWLRSCIFLIRSSSRPMFGGWLHSWIFLIRSSSRPMHVC